MFNLSTFGDNQTASTQVIIASQRAKIIANLNKKNVLELCVGPSLKVLETSYSKLGINLTGNDIEYRWKKFYPQGQWIIGDCFSIDYNLFDMVVFAPPLGKGCSGKREDSLMIENINPSYYDFINKFKQSNIKNACLVLPARSLSTKQDRSQYYKLLSLLNNDFICEIKEMKDNKQIRKYIDVYIQKK